MAKTSRGLVSLLAAVALLLAGCAAQTPPPVAAPPAPASATSGAPAASATPAATSAAAPSTADHAEAPAIRTDAPVVVVCAGLAGLTVAYQLKKAGIDALVLETSPRVGGRVQTVIFPAGAT